MGRCLTENRKEGYYVKGLLFGHVYTTALTTLSEYQNKSIYDFSL